MIITSEHSVTRTPAKELADVNTERKSIRHRATIILSVSRTCVAEKRERERENREEKLGGGWTVTGLFLFIHQ